MHVIYLKLTELVMTVAKAGRAASRDWSLAFWTVFSGLFAPRTKSIENIPKSRKASVEKGGP
jgi:hypothetical protein